MVNPFVEDLGQRAGLSCLGRNLWPCGFALKPRSAVDDCRIVCSESAWLGSQGDFPAWCDQIHLTQSWWGLGRMCWQEHGEMVEIQWAGWLQETLRMGSGALTSPLCRSFSGGGPSGCLADTSQEPGDALLLPLTLDNRCVLPRRCRFRRKIICRMSQFVCSPCLYNCSFSFVDW